MSEGIFVEICIALYFLIIPPEFERVFAKQIVRFWLVLYYTDKWLSCLDIHLHTNFTNFINSLCAEMSRPKCPAIETAQTETARPNRPDRNGQTEKSCTLFETSKGPELVEMAS